MKLKILIGITILLLWNLSGSAQNLGVEIEGAVKIGNYTGDSTKANAGIIRWNGSDFEGWNGLNWRSLTSYILNNDNVILPDSALILPPVAFAPPSPLDHLRLTDGPLWSIDGNFINGNFNPSYYQIPYPRLGTTDNFPVVFITNNVERMRIRVDGDITINRSVYFNTDTLGTQTINNGPFTVTNISPTLLSGILTVDKRTLLNDKLEVFGPTKLNNTLFVDNKGLSTFPSEFKGAVKISDTTQSDGAIETGSAASPPINLTVNTSKGALVVDGGAGVGRNFNVGGDFAVQGSTAFGGAVSFYSPLSIKATEQSETIWVGDTITGALRVFGGTGIRGKLNVGNDFSIRQQPVTLPYNDPSDPMNVFNINATNGQVTIKNNLFPSTPDLVPVILPGINSTHDMNFDNYPLRIEGSNQGIAIKISGSRSNDNNFMSFWDENQMWGRIEGETIAEFANSPGYRLAKKGQAYTEFAAEVSEGFAIANTVIAALQLVKASLDFRICVGFGICVALPSIAGIAFAVIEVASAGTQLHFAQQALGRARELTTIFDTNKSMLEGVTYKSGAGDYAEYLLRAEFDEKISAGEVIGVIGGKVSKNTTNAERILVVSSKPIVLGNMPQPGEEEKYEKVAFMGQIPVKVFGKVSIGDYIIPSGNNDGVGIAIPPSEMKSQDVKNIIGVAWSESEITFGYNTVMVAVGLNRNDNNQEVSKLESQVNQQDIEINEMKKMLNDAFATVERIKNREEGSVSNSGRSTAQVFGTSGIHNERKYEIMEIGGGELVSWDITEADFDKAMVFLENLYRQHNLDYDNNIVFQQIKNDPNYKNQMFKSVKEKLIELYHDHQEKHHGLKKH